MQWFQRPIQRHFRCTRTKMPLLQPLLELGCLSQMQTNKANSTNWLDVWAKLLYGFNGRWSWTRSKESHAHCGLTVFPCCPMGLPRPICTSSHHCTISPQLCGEKKSIVIVGKYGLCRSPLSLLPWLGDAATCEFKVRCPGGGQSGPMVVSDQEENKCSILVELSRCVTFGQMWRPLLSTSHLFLIGGFTPV